MESAHKLLCLWPGVYSLWRRGDGSGLAVAILFAALCNFLLVTTLLWPELLAAQWVGWFGPGVARAGAGLVKVTGWSVLAAWWLVSWWRSAAAARRPNRAKQQASNDALLRDAQCEYLKGHWFEAEAKAQQLLRAHPADVEAKLLLAAVYRRSRRLAEAGTQLAELGQMPSAGRWGFEIDREVRVLEEMRAEAQGSAAMRAA